MQDNTLSLQRLTHFAILLFLVIYLLSVGRALLVPLAFGALFAFMLMPVAWFIERYVPWRIPAILVTLLIAIIPIVGIVALFSSQFAAVFQSMPAIGERLNAGLTSLFSWINEQFGYTRAETEQMIREQSSKILQSPMFSISKGLSTSSAILSGIVLTLVYTLLFLLYRSAIKKFILVQVTSQKKDSAEELLGNIQKVVQDYLYSLLMVMLVLTTLLSLGFWMIGIKHALLWGAFAGFMAIIPYIGSFLGGFLPFIYALATGDHAWQPWAVIGISAFVQFLEGNIITPNIVGNTVNINPLAAIIALFAGGQIWGIAGMILALPFVAILKVMMDNVDFLKPVGHLLSDDIYQKEELLETKLDRERFRLRSFFKTRQPATPAADKKNGLEGQGKKN